MPDDPPTKRQVFFARLSSTVVLWAIVTLGIVLKLPWLFFLVIGGLGFLALIETLKMFGVNEEKRYYVWTLVNAILYLANTWHASTWSRQADWDTRDVFFLTLHLFVLFTLTLLRPLDGQRTLVRLIGSFFAFFYTIVLFNFLNRLLVSGPGEPAFFLVLYVVAVTKFTDMGAYAVGSLIGKHKMIPHISPGKTWQGFGGAILGAYAASCLIYFPFRASFHESHLHLVVILPFILALTTVVGDLAESVVKRCLDVKDSGKMLPGIGGALDLIDSLCFTAPVLYYYLLMVT